MRAGVGFRELALAALKEARRGFAGGFWGGGEIGREFGEAGEGDGGGLCGDGAGADGAGALEELDEVLDARGGGPVGELFEGEAVEGGDLEEAEVGGEEVVKEGGVGVLGLES